MKFSGGESKVREERSNAGVEALAQSVLKNILGLTDSTSREIIGMLQQRGEDALMRQNLKLLSITAHTRLNQILDVLETTDASVNDDLDPEDIDGMIDAVDQTENEVEPDFDDYDPLTDPDDPDNVQIMGMSNLRPDRSVPWDPEQDREDALTSRKSSPPVSNPNDYIRKESARSSFLSYLNEMSREGRIDAEISKMTDEMDDELDPVIKKQIDRAEANGDSRRASALRDNAKRRLGLSNKPKRPTQQRVEQKKKELADALKKDRIAASTEGE